MTLHESSGRTLHINTGTLQDFPIYFNDIGSGTPVVMLHGSGPGASGVSNFSRNVDAFVAAGHRVVLIDLPGWGRSGTVVVKSGNRIPINVDAVLGVLEALHIEQAHLLGNSMGGATALKFALQHPGRCGKLVVMGGGAGGQSLFVPMPSEGIKAMVAAYRQPTLESLKRMMSASMEANPKHLMAEFADQLPSVKARTLVVWGRDDRCVPLDAALRLT